MAAVALCARSDKGSVMGTISSGIGLISGIDHEDLIDKLMAIEARSQTLVKNRNTVLQSQQTAYQEINAKLLALKLAMSTLTSTKTFRGTTATSSNENVLTATSSYTTTPGTYQFTVSRLVSSQQMITAGFADTNTTPVGAGTLTFESAAAKLERDTKLEELSFIGGSFQRGSIRITDRSGASAQIDLSQAVSVNDILEAINGASVSVTASVSGDSLQITDTSGGTGNLVVANVGAKTTASSLGIAGSVADSTLTGQPINRLTQDTLLSRLNDGNGIRITSGAGMADFQVTQRDGATFNVDLTNVATVGDLLKAINTATGNTSVTAAIAASGTGLVLTDVSAGGTLTVTALNGSGAAADLGILGSDGDGDGVVEGTRVLSALNSKLLKNLNGGAGVRLGSISITNRLGAVTAVDLSSARSVADVMSLINAAGAGVTVSLNSARNGLLITDTTGGSASNLVISGDAAADLGLAFNGAASSVNSGNLQLRYVSEGTLLASLNGGAGITRGKFRITDSNGYSATVDLTQGNELTVGDVIEEINSRFAGGTVVARINDHGDGILLEDHGSGLAALKVQESGSTTARDLGILGEAVSAGDNLDGSFEKTITIDAVATLTTDSLLSSLNQGRGVRVVSGKDDFKITNSAGKEISVSLTGVTTIQGVLDAINNDADNDGTVTAEISSTGLGLVLRDRSTGGGSFSVTVLNSSHAAEDLGIVGSSPAGQIQGSSVVGVTTLQNLVDRINALGAGIRANIINDGSALRPYRLNLTSAREGTAGGFIFDDGGVGLEASELASARDAVVFLGDPGQNGLAITSSTNSLRNTVLGTTIDLHSASSSPVSLTVARDDAAAKAAANELVTKFNDLIDAINKYDSYDAETKTRGLLFGDSTVNTIKQSLLNRLMGRSSDVSGQYTRLSQVGITVGTGEKLSFNADKFASALAADRSAVESLFTYKVVKKDESGNTVFGTDGKPVYESASLGVTLEDLVGRLSDKVLDSRTDGLTDEINSNKERIDYLQTLLDAKRARLETQFNAMETALAQLQGQSQSLTTLSTLASSIKSSSK